MNAKIYLDSGTVATVTNLSKVKEMLRNTQTQEYTDFSDLEFLDGYVYAFVGSNTVVVRGKNILCSFFISSILSIPCRIILFLASHDGYFVVSIVK